MGKEQLQPKEVKQGKIMRKSLSQDLWNIFYPVNESEHPVRQTFQGNPSLSRRPTTGVDKGGRVCRGDEDRVRRNQSHGEYAERLLKTVRQSREPSHDTLDIETVVTLDDVPFDLLPI